MLETATAPEVETVGANGVCDQSAAQRRARIIAFYLPQFHAIPENDAWWGKGFTEWTNVGRAKPLYPGHLQPRLPTELGYYDLRVPEVREQQAALAREHGIEGFCYWHYWFNGRRILQRPFEEVLASGKPDFPFCLGWANQTWTGIWHGAPNRILIEQTYGGEEDARRHFEAVLPAFHDPRYLRLDGRPIFMLHQPQDLPEPRAFTASWQRWARAEGLPGICFLGDADTGWNAHDYGFDGSIISALWRVLQHRRVSRADTLMRRVFAGRHTTWLRKRLRDWPTRIDYSDVIRAAIPSHLDAAEYPTILPNWDNTPRSGKNGVVFVNTSAESFGEHLATAVSMVKDRPPDQRLVFLKSWNEWAEGNFVEPDAVHGRTYLEAIRRAVVANAA